MPFDPFSEDDGDPDRDLGEALRAGRPEVVRAFALVALAVQVGLFAASLGVMLLWFRGQEALGGGLVIAGAIALAGAVAIYRRHRDRP